LGRGVERTWRTFLVNAVGRKLDFENGLAAQGVSQYLSWWGDLGGDPRRMFEFMLSDFVTSLPLIRIKAQLFAKMVTSNDTVQSGDVGDARLLSTAIPLVHFVLTDKRIERRIKELGIDRDWNTRVFSMSTIDGLFADLEGLRGQAA